MPPKDSLGFAASLARSTERRPGATIVSTSMNSPVDASASAAAAAALLRGVASPPEPRRLLRPDTSPPVVERSLSSSDTLIFDSSSRPSEPRGVCAPRPGPLWTPSLWCSCSSTGSSVGW